MTETTEICSMNISNGIYLFIANLNYNAKFKRIEIVWTDSAGNDTIIVFKLVSDDNLIEETTLIKVANIENGTLSLRAIGTGVVHVDPRINFLQTVKL